MYALITKILIILALFIFIIVISSIITNNNKKSAGADQNELLDTITNKNPKTILIVGRGGTGKSYSAQSISKLGYKIVSIDETIRNMSKSHPAGESLFKLYNDDHGGFEKELQELMDILKSESGKVIYEGMLLPNDVKLLNPDMVIYVEPVNWDDYRNQLVQRFLNDINTGQQTIGILWRFLPNTLNKTQDIINTKEFKEALSKAVEHAQKRNNEEREEYKFLNPIYYQNRIIQKPALLFISGLEQKASTWSPIIHKLQTFDCLPVELPPATDIEKMQNQILSTTNYYKPLYWIVVAHSAGAILATDIAKKLNAKHLVLLDPTHQPQLDLVNDEYLNKIKNTPSHPYIKLFSKSTIIPDVFEPTTVVYNVDLQKQKSVEYGEYIKSHYKQSYLVENLGHLFYQKDPMIVVDRINNIL
jgi:hypothetical protein